MTTEDKTKALLADECEAAGYTMSARMIRAGTPSDAERIALRAIEKAYVAGVGDAARICEEQARVFSSDEYATPQPIGSIMERFACSTCATAIRALTPNLHTSAEPVKDGAGGLRVETTFVAVGPCQHKRLAAMATTGMMSCTDCRWMRQMTPEEFAHWNPPFEEGPKP